MVQEESSGSCSVAVVGSGSAVAKKAAVAVTSEHSWSPSVAHSSHLSGQVGCTDGTSASSLWALVLCLSCFEACRLDSWGGVARQK